MVKNKNEKYLRINIIVIKAERIYSKIERYKVDRKIYR